MYVRDSNVTDSRLDGVSIRAVRQEAAQRRLAKERRRLIMKGLTVAMAIFATFMVAVALGVAAIA